MRFSISGACFEILDTVLIGLVDRCSASDSEHRAIDPSNHFYLAPVCKVCAWYKVIIASDCPRALIVRTVWAHYNVLTIPTLINGM